MKGGSCLTSAGKLLHQLLISTVRILCFLRYRYFSATVASLEYTVIA